MPRTGRRLHRHARLTIAVLLALVLLPVSAPAAQATAYNEIPINGSNSFVADEEFSTSTDAATGYAAYATWDREPPVLRLHRLEHRGRHRRREPATGGGRAEPEPLHRLLPGRRPDRGGGDDAGRARRRAVLDAAVPRRLPGPDPHGRGEHAGAGLHRRGHRQAVERQRVAEHRRRAAGHLRQQRVQLPRVLARPAPTSRTPSGSGSRAGSTTPRRTSATGTGPRRPPTTVPRPPAQLTDFYGFVLDEDGQIRTPRTARRT